MKKVLTAIALAVVALSLTVVLITRSGNASKVAAVENARKILERDGFKTRLADFDFSVSPETRQRAAALTNAVLRPNASQERWMRFNQLLSSKDLDLMQLITTNAARVVWTHFIRTDSEEEIWAEIRKVIEERKDILDLASQASLAGSIGFELASSGGSSMLLPHLSLLKYLAQQFALRAMLELHEGNCSAAWTDLLACSRLSTGWDPEPAEVSHVVRFSCATIAFNALWQALQTNAWTDAQLVEMQAQWQEANFFKGFPEIVAFTRASMVDACQRERQLPIASPFSGISLLNAIKRPHYLWDGLNLYRRQLHYRKVGSYEDERGLLLHFRDREIEMRKAITRATWAEMRLLPGVTNQVRFSSKHSSSFIAMYNASQISLSFQRAEMGFLGRAAEAEARRRLIITALGLERYRLRFGTYPQTLADLQNEKILHTTDFMNGKPMHYRVNERGFILYSVGLDCLDDGGIATASISEEEHMRPRQWLGKQTLDIVWPRKADQAEITSREEEQRRVAELRRQQQIQDEAARELAAAKRRLEVVELLEKAYASNRGGPVKDVRVNGKPLSTLIQRRKSLPRLSLEQLLALKQVHTGEEPELITFEVLADYNAVTRLGELCLLVDPDPDDLNDSELGAFQECTPGTNGSCLLSWNTTHDPPGKHFLRACLEAGEFSVTGPLLPFYSSNIFQFDPLNGSFSDKGALLSARMARPVGTYQIEVTGADGEHLKTFRGSTSNGLIEVYWDLIDDQGRRYTHESFQTEFSATFADDAPPKTPSETNHLHDSDKQP